MSLIGIADAIGTVRKITGEDVRSVGASLFVDRELGAAEIDRIMRELDAQDIEEVEAYKGTARQYTKTRIDL